MTGISGGYSTDAYGELNLALHVGDDPHAVQANRKLIEQSVGRPIMYMQQYHSDQIISLTPNAALLDDEAGAGDAMVVRAADWLGQTPPALAVLVADCLPLALVEENGDFGAVVHAGRAGVVQNIVGKTVMALRTLGARQQRLIPVIGPSICKECYEVDQTSYEDVMRVWKKNNHPTSHPKKGYHVDLFEVVSAQLQAAGVIESPRTIEGCTQENLGFFSYRRAQKPERKTGRQALILAL